MKLLQNDVATISEIAYRVGFSSPSYFYKSFQKYYGCPPGEIKHIFHNKENKAFDKGVLDPKFTYDYTYKNLHSNPQFITLLNKMGLHPTESSSY